MTNSNLRDHALRTVNAALVVDTDQALEFTKDHIGNRVKEFLSLPMYKDLTSADAISLQRFLESQFTVSVPVEAILEEQGDHQPWLPDWRAENPWKFWNQYKNLLESRGNLPDQSIRSIDRVTDKVLERLENPSRPGAWDRRGMIVGQVQSGKTSNYIGLIAKAADAGYKMIVVLAGATESLRCQTQQRLDEGFLGWETRRGVARDTGQHRIGVGATGSDFERAMSATSSANQGDFGRQAADQNPVVIGSAEPMLFVVKKNVHVLENVIAWATAVVGRNVRDSEDIVVEDIPLLVIDDEADYASVNTQPMTDENGRPDPEADPARINGLIRRLLRSFQKSAYCAYTATPYANIFIAPEAKSDSFGKDLFPSDFILNIKPPTNYIGPVKVFGLDDPQDGNAEVRRLPLERTIRDTDAWIPDRHRKTLIPGSMPRSLETAIHSFILACAIRATRGETGIHNSMLVHVTRFVDVQDLVATQVEDYLDSVRNRIRYGDGNARESIMSVLRSLFEQDFVPTTEAVRNFDEDLRRDVETVSWEDVESNIDASTQRIVVHRVNGTSKDSLQYWDAEQGLSVIAIGGDRLSRGLTLEGLTVSYFLRASRMYDTLMQMGRWFGYRPGYADVCRLYTSAQLGMWYADIARADQELRAEFDRMEDLGSTPREFGLKVRSHSGGLVITGSNKIRNGVRMSLAFSGQAPQPLHFFTRQSALDRNFNALEQLCADSGVRPKITESKDLKFESVEGARIAEFFQRLSDVPPRVRAANPVALANYIASQLSNGELTDWTVVIRSNSTTQNKKMLAGQEVGLSVRGRDEDVPNDEDEFAIKVLTGTVDESLDLDKAKIRNLEEFAKKNNRSVTREDYRDARLQERGLLIIYLLQNPDDPANTPLVGYAPSFPYSDTAQPLEYVVGRDYWQQGMAL